ncbi:MAG TPA: carboxypeptidase regulatory-like domain-containing protein [Bryobacteraceae bacterium]|nr:carboxypeptidase regulatory-like domain-containing protein [Bryobacteraceae bacterium]
MGRVLGIVILAPVLSAMLAPAADLEGLIVVKRKLTKRKVTAAVSSYQRGSAVELDTAQREDDLAFERTRVAIYVDGPRASAPVTVTMEQKNRRFVPDTVVVPAGSSVSFPNLDPIFHNVFSLSKPKSFDLGNYPKDHSRQVTFSKPGIVFVNCHLHPNMGAVIVVTPNRWSTKADPAGRFVLSGIPDGSYTVVAWHKAAGFFRQQVRVTGNHLAAPLQFFIPLVEDGTPHPGAQR